MILNFEERGYIDVDRIAAMRWFKDTNRGAIIFDGERIDVESEPYKIIETSYLRVHNTHMHGEDMKKMYFVRREKKEGEL